jgi:hypothetical protein
MSKMRASACGQGREGQGHTALVMPGIWPSIYAHHTAREALVANIAGRLSLAKMFGVWASTILTRHGFGRFNRQSIMVSKAEDMVGLTMALSARFRVNGDDLDDTLPSPKRQHYLCRTTHDRRC